jgi:RNA polymerase sigma factor (sigma-70 family)
MSLSYSKPGLPGQPRPALNAIDRQESSDEQPPPMELLEMVYRVEAPRLIRYFRDRLRHKDDATDLVHDAFVRLAGAMAQSPLSNPGPYLQRIARNLLYDRSKRLERRLSAFHLPIGEGDEPETGPHQCDWIEANDLLRLYRRALDDLPERTRVIFLLHRVDELTYKDIGIRLGLSIPTVQYHVSRALSCIDAALKQE